VKDFVHAETASKEGRLEIDGISRPFTIQFMTSHGIHTPFMFLLSTSSHRQVVKRGSEKHKRASKPSTLTTNSNSLTDFNPHQRSIKCASNPYAAMPVAKSRPTTAIGITIDALSRFAMAELSAVSPWRFMHPCPLLWVSTGVRTPGVPRTRIINYQVPSLSLRREGGPGGLLGKRGKSPYISI